VPTEAQDEALCDIFAAVGDIGERLLRRQRAAPPFGISVPEPAHRAALALETPRVRRGFANVRILVRRAKFGCAGSNCGTGMCGPLVAESRVAGVDGRMLFFA
jgi:hypothetical protein